MGIIGKVVLAGFSIFSMVFGSSNIVFPLIIGKDSMANFSYSALGWLLATVLIPMIGYFGAMLFDADNKKYLSPLGKHATAILMFIIMMMVGPFGVIARGVNVSFGGVHILAPQVSEVLFNAIYCFLTILLAWHPGKIVQVIGVIFTPLKFGGMIAVIFGALFFANSLTDIEPAVNSAAIDFLKGFEVGYQTMDLLSAFLVATTIFIYIKNSMPEEKRENNKEVLKMIGMACIVGSVVLSVVYFGLVFVGAVYAPQLLATPDEALFTKIAELAMGGYASWFVATVIAACCLATNIVLSSVFTDYVHKDLLKEKFNRKIILLAVGCVTFAMSLLGFERICGMLGKILSAIYPALIIFVVLRIGYWIIKCRKNL